MYKTYTMELAGRTLRADIGRVDRHQFRTTCRIHTHNHIIQCNVITVILREQGTENRVLEAIYKAHEVNQTIIEFINKIVAEVGKPKHTYESCAIPEQMFEDMKKIITPEEMETAVFTDEKQVREENIRKITEKLEEAFADSPSTSPICVVAHGPSNGISESVAAIAEPSIAVSSGRHSGSTE